MKTSVSKVPHSSERRHDKTILYTEEQQHVESWGLCLRGGSIYIDRFANISAASRVKELTRVLFNESCFYIPMDLVRMVAEYDALAEGEYNMFPLPEEAGIQMQTISEPAAVQRLDECREFNVEHEGLQSSFWKRVDQRIVELANLNADLKDRICTSLRTKHIAANYKLLDCDLQTTLLKTCQVSSGQDGPRVIVIVKLGPLWIDNSTDWAWGVTPQVSAVAHVCPGEDMEAVNSPFISRT